MMTERDLDLLSAYLDGELSSDARAALEARLDTDPALRRELDGLRATVGLLRGLPTLPAPRSFTLTPEQARRERGARVTAYMLHSAAFRVMSAAAVALIVFGAALFALSSNVAAPPAAAPLQGVAALSTSTPAQGQLAFASASPAPTQQPQPTVPMVLQSAAEPSPRPDTANTAADSAPAQPADESAAAEAAPPAALFAVPADETIVAEAFGAETDAAGVQRTFEEQEGAAGSAITLDSLTAQGEIVALMTATPMPTLPPASGLAMQATHSPLPAAGMIAQPTQPPPMTAQARRTAAPSATAVPTQTALVAATVTVAPTQTASAAATLMPTAAPTVSAPAPRSPAVTTPDIGLLLIGGGVLLLVAALALALSRGRIRG